MGGDNNTLTTCLAHVVSLVLGFGSAVIGALLIGVAAAGATAVEKDAVAGAGNSVAFAGAAAGGAGHGGWGASGAAGAGEGWDVAVGIGVVIGLIVDLDLLEAGGELVERGGLAGDDVLGLTGPVWAGRDDARGRDGTALGDGLGLRAGVAAGLDGGGGSGNIEDVQLAASRGLDGVLLGGIVGDVVAIEDALS